MATIVNTPPQTNSDNGMGFLLGAILLIVFALVVIFYGLPLLSSGFHSAAPQVNIPDHVNVNVQQPGK